MIVIGNVLSFFNKKKTKKKATDGVFKKVDVVDLKFRKSEELLSKNAKYPAICFGGYLRLVRNSFFDFQSS